MRVTALYAALLTLFYLYLTWRVIGFRRAHRVDMGSGDHLLLRRYVRAHGNFVEYAPLSLVLLGLLDLGGWPFWLLHLLGLGVLAGRLAHAWSFSVEEPRLRSRSLGMVLTLTSLVLLALLSLTQAFV